MSYYNTRLVEEWGLRENIIIDSIIPLYNRSSFLVVGGTKNTDNDQDYIRFTTLSLYYYFGGSTELKNISSIIHDNKIEKISYDYAQKMYKQINKKIGNSKHTKLILSREIIDGTVEFDDPECFQKNELTIKQAYKIVDRNLFKVFLLEIENIFEGLEKTYVLYIGEGNEYIQIDNGKVRYIKYNNSENTGLFGLIRSFFKLVENAFFYIIILRFGGGLIYNSFKGFWDYLGINLYHLIKSFL